MSRSLRFSLITIKIKKNTTPNEEPKRNSLQSPPILDIYEATTYMSIDAKINTKAMNGTESLY